MYTLTDANDLAMVVKDEVGMKGMMRRLERYLNRKSPEVDTEKTKVMRCRMRREKDIKKKRGVGNVRCVVGGKERGNTYGRYRRDGVKGRGGKR